MELTDFTLTQASELISGQVISPVELTKAHLARIEKLNHRLNCFITVTPERALEDARKAEEEIQHGNYRGVLHGIPIALKDLFETRGIRTTAGSRFFSDYVPGEDGVVVNKLVEAGTVLLGKLNMHEIALGVTNNNPHFGPCRNPWLEDRVPGGSSGGCGAGLSADLCMGALGSDTGGSIRIPSSLCGVVGLKPTYGRISLRGVIPLSWNLDHIGPMARRVMDAALLLQAITGYDASDPTSFNVPWDDLGASLGKELHGWRIALADDPFFQEIDPQVREAVQAAARVFESLGATVEAVEFPQARQAAQANGVMVTSDAAAFHKERLASHPEDFGADILQRLRNGAAYTSTEYILARRFQSELRRNYEAFFQQYDVLLTPTTPIAAPMIEGQDAVEQARLLTRFTAPFNLTGLPALSLPCGFTTDGLPIGLQIIAGPWKEAKVLQAGLAYEQASLWHLRKPELGV